MNRAEYKKFIIRALGRMDGMPMPQASLINATRDAFNPKPTMGDVQSAMSELETDGYILGTQDKFDLTYTWTLTDLGRHQAAKLA